MTRREFRDLADPEAVRAAVAGLALDAGVESVPLRAARGRVLAERVDAPLDVPGFDRAAMDGYAVRAADTVGASEVDPVELSVVGVVRAGERPAFGDESDADDGESDAADAEPQRELAAGEAVRVATGAVLPPGADAVVPVERTIERDDAVDVATAVTPGGSVAPRGDDVAAGDRTLAPGAVLTARHVGVLAALGRESVPVRRRPRVGVVSTGEELVPPGEALDPGAGQVHDVNSYSLAAAVERAGGEPVPFASSSDEHADLREALEDAAAACELVLTSGSTSAGEADLLPDLVAEHGRVLVHGVALKPGRPLLIGRVFDAPYVGLPGYPVSALTVFRTFVAPALRSAAGLPDSETATTTAELAAEVRYEGGRLRLLPVGLVEDGAGSSLAYAQDRHSGATSQLVETDGVVQMAPERNVLPAGEAVDVALFDADAPLPSILGTGEPDPLVGRLLDALDAPRFLSRPPLDAARWFDDGVPDLLVAPPTHADVDADAERLAAIEREWGLAVPAGTPDDVTGIEDLRDDDLRFASLDDDLALRAALDAELASRDAGATACDADAAAGADDDRFADRELPGIASAARSVAEDRADAGLALRATAADLDLDFVPIGSQRLDLLVREDRREKRGVERLAGRCESRLPDLAAELPGYEVVER